jgi:hypothetical protein
MKAQTQKRIAIEKVGRKKLAHFLFIMIMFLAFSL